MPTLPHETQIHLTMLMLKFELKMAQKSDIHHRRTISIIEVVNNLYAAKHIVICIPILKLFMKCRILFKYLYNKTDILLGINEYHF